MDKNELKRKQDPHKIDFNALFNAEFVTIAKPQKTDQEAANMDKDHFWGVDPIRKERSSIQPL